MGLSYKQTNQKVPSKKYIAEQVWQRSKNEEDLVIEGDIPDLDNKTIALLQKNCKKELPTDMEMESIPLKDLSTLVEQVHVATREAATTLLILTKLCLRIHEA